MLGGLKFGLLQCGDRLPGTDHPIFTCHPDLSGEVVRPTHRAVADMPDLNLQTCGGKTSFSAAFSECRQVMCQSPPESNEFILFFTDAWPLKLP